MPKLDPESMTKLQTCHQQIQDAVILCAEYWPGKIKVTCGHRGAAEQVKLLAEKRTKVPWPQSKHNVFPSMAVDLAIVEPDGTIKWGTKEDPEIQEWTFFAGFFMCCLRHCGINARWGGDWDGDLDMDDNSFNDFPHFEIKSLIDTFQLRKGG